MPSYFDYLPAEYRNPLTNLPNRLAVKERLDDAIRQLPGAIGFLQIDVDGLKEVNDTNGHHEGDELLKTIAAVLEDSLRESDDFLPAHISGDEFSVIVRGVTELKELITIQERIRTTLADYGIEASIGGRSPVR